MTAADYGLGELRALSSLIQASIDKLEAELAAKGQAFPSLDTPFSAESEAVRTTPEAEAAISNIVAAGAQLIALSRPSVLSVAMAACQFHVSSGLRAVIQAHVPEILREAGPKGLHVNEIALYTKINEAKLSRILRLLATNHIFKEIVPDVFTHNRISSTLDTGKSVKAILADPEAKHDATSGVAAAVEHLSDEGIKSSAFMPEALFNPKFSNSGKPDETALNLAFATELGAFTWLELPENSYRRRRFGLAMRINHHLLATTQGYKGFDWAALPKNSVVVDVGGGIGSQTLLLARSFSHLRYVVQDRAATLKDAEKFWDAEFPEAVTSGRVTLQAHNFFQPQPQTSAAVFFLRYILHDWADEHCIDILSHLHAASRPDTKLVIVDRVLSYACGDADDVLGDVPGAVVPPAPTPLLPNHGYANVQNYLIDMTMLCICNGQERTNTHFQNLFEKAGWKLVQIFRQGSSASQIIGVPA